MTIIIPQQPAGGGAGPQRGPEGQWELIDEAPERRSAVPQLLTGLAIALLVAAAAGATLLTLGGSGFLGVLALVALGAVWLGVVIGSLFTVLRVRAHRRAQLLLTALAVVLNPLTVFIVTGIIATLV